MSHTPGVNISTNTVHHCSYTPIITWLYRCLLDEWRGSVVSTSESTRLTSFADELPAKSTSSGHPTAAIYEHRLRILRHTLQLAEYNVFFTEFLPRDVRDSVMCVCFSKLRPQAQSS